MINILNEYGTVIENVNLKRYNTYKIGGIAKYLISPNDINSLKELITYLNKENIKYMVLGNGSNVIFSDDLYDGVIIKLDNFKNITIDNTKITVESGVMLPNLVKVAIQKNLVGLEWASGIPGTLGGSIYGNAGAYKSEIADFIENITIMDKLGNIKILKKEDVDFSYRYSSFKDKYKECIILNATLNLEKGNKEEALKLIHDRLERRLSSQPLEYPSAGSVFRNPEGDAAGRIIEHEIKFKGKRIGGAEVSKKHANFIINTGSASSKDIKDLIELIHKEVLEKTNIDLIIEQEFINWE